jgi:hypothetical protein
MVCAVASNFDGSGVALRPARYEEDDTHGDTQCGFDRFEVLHYVSQSGRWQVPGVFKQANKRELLQRVKLQMMGTLLLGLLAAPGVFAQKITVEFDRAADFSKYKTFAIRDGQLNSKNAALNSELVKKRIESDIERSLTAKGLEMTTGKADLNVVYRFGSARKTELESYPAGWYGLGTRIVRVPYAEGTLVIDLRDPTTRSLVWRGIATEEKSDATKIEGKLDDMVKKSFDKYPPKK